LQHLQIAVGVTEREDRPQADEAVDADGLAVINSFGMGYSSSLGIEAM
jgi:hypothetical protein